MRLTDADEAVKALGKAPFVRDDYIDEYEMGRRKQWEQDIEAITALPTIEAEPVRRGRWIWDDEGYHCSECFFHAYGATLECMDGTYKYCPHCGAKMEEPEE